MPIVSLIGCGHQDQRNLVTGDASSRSFYDATSFLPFARGGLRGLIDPPIALPAGLIVTILLRSFHPILFGGA